jgi:hypothetical protein
VITSTKDSLLEFQGKQQDTESGLDNVRRMYSPTLARFLPTRVATVPKKLKGVPAPQSLNPSTLAASNPIFQPGSLASFFIGLFSPTPGSEGNNPCADFGCYPGPPDPVDAFLDVDTCDCVAQDVKPDLVDACKYTCTCKPHGPGELAFSMRRLKRQCNWTSVTRCPKFVTAEAEQIISIIGTARAIRCSDTPVPKPN